MKIAIIGCGAWAAEYCRRLKKFFPEEQLYFCSRDLARAAEYRRMFRGKGHFDDLQALVKEVSPEAVMIFTPHHAHLENVRALAGSGAYILLQKPIGACLSDACGITALAEGKELPLMMAENFRYRPSVLKMKEILDKGCLGRPVYAVIDIAMSYTPSGWRANAVTMGGGVLVDFGIHYLNTLRYLFGNPSEVSAVFPGHPAAFEGEGERAVCLWSKHPAGACANMSLSWGLDRKFRHRENVSVVCEKGSLSFSMQERFLKVIEGKRTSRIFLGWRDLGGNTALLRDFISRAEKKLPISLNARSGLNDFLFAGAAYESAKEKKTILMKDFCRKNSTDFKND
jgi:predicted dehydrogenase